MAVEVRVPSLGESVTEATVATWFKKPGDTVAADEMLCELETDKVTVEVPAPAAGTLGELLAEEGSTVGPNALLATISEGAGAAAPAQAAPAQAAPAQAAPAQAAPAQAGSEAPGVGIAPQDSPATAPATAAVGAPTGPAASYSGITPDEAQASTPSRTEAERAGYAQEIKDRAAARDVADAPSAVKMMADKDVPREAVEATGRDGRVMKEDVLRALQQPKAPPEAPKSAPAPRAPTAAQDVGREERVRMTRLRQTIARRLKEAQNTAAMLTTYNEVDMSAVMAIRAEYKDAFEKKHKVKLGFMSFFVKACVHALLEVPEVNAEIDGEDVVYKRYVHMGVAVGTPSGLVVPVVRDVGDKGFAQIEKEIGELGARARDGKLAMADMQGGTFTISNGGVYGSLMSSPILNPPQSGILGMHKIQDRPVVLDGQIVVRPMMYLALSYDHRIVDGKGAVTFLVRVKEAIEDPRRLLMDL